jgi:Icc-related predicted phosphoesterase
MKLWCISDLHDDRGLLDIERPAKFDVLVCAGDMLTGDIAGSIEMTARLAGGRDSVFVAGNHEWMSAADKDEVVEEALATALREGVRFLECDSTVVGVTRFAGATLWEPADPRFEASVAALVRAKADVVVTHFEPPAKIWTAVGAKLWIYGHEHGFSDLKIGHNRLVRNALGHMHEMIHGEPARNGLVIEV